MVKGIDSFKNWFQGYEEPYVIIGGTACDILMTNEELSFSCDKRYRSCSDCRSAKRRLWEKILGICEAGRIRTSQQEFWNASVLPVQSSPIRSIPCDD